MFDIDKSLNKMLGTTKKRGGSKDWDGDGVPNKKDCQPRNIMRQDISEYKRPFGAKPMFVPKVYRDRSETFINLWKQIRSTTWHNRHKKGSKPSRPINEYGYVGAIDYTIDKRQAQINLNRLQKILPKVKIALRDNKITEEEYDTLIRSATQIEEVLQRKVSESN